jgi:hypothetical protein
VAGGEDETEVFMSNRVMAVVVAGSLLLSASGSALAAGSKGSIGGDQFRTSRPAYAGKMGGITGGLDRSAYAASTGDEAGEDVDPPTAQGAKKGIEPGKS